MLAKYWIHLAELTVAILLALAIYFSWRADRRDRAELAAELAATKQLLAAADVRQHDRDAHLAQTLATLAAEKRTIATPEQIVRELPKITQLPTPMTLQAAETSSVGATLGSPAANASNASAGEASPRPTDGEKPALQGAFIPHADLKPLYDFTLDCKACQAKLSASEGDLADERKKTAALTRERDDALRIARGGTVLRRIGRAAKWFLIGAATGAIAAKSAH